MPKGYPTPKEKQEQAIALGRQHIGWKPNDIVEGVAVRPYVDLTRAEHGL